jgi:hypothetical protein
MFRYRWWVLFVSFWAVVGVGCSTTRPEEGLDFSLLSTIRLNDPDPKRTGYIDYMDGTVVVSGKMERFTGKCDNDLNEHGYQSCGEGLRVVAELRGKVPPGYKPDYRIVDPRTVFPYTGLLDDSGFNRFTDFDYKDSSFRVSIGYPYHVKNCGRDWEWRILPSKTAATFCANGEVVLLETSWRALDLFPHNSTTARQIYAFSSPDITFPKLPY